MALIALAADKGSPGVTTAAVALSAVWPRRTLLAETDPAGGDLVYRTVAQHGGPLDPNTGMLSVAATGRRGIAAEQLWDHAQPMSGGLDVLVGIGTSDQSAGLVGLWPTLGRAFASLAESPHGGADVIADCGRISAESGTVELLRHAAIVLLVSRTDPEQLARVRDRAAALSAKLHGNQRGAAQVGTPLIGIVLVADPSGAPKVAGQVDRMLTASQSPARVIGVLAQDTAGAEQLAGRRRGRVDKSLLVRSARKIVSDLHQHYGTSLLAPAQGTMPTQPTGTYTPPQQPTAPAPPAGQAYTPPGQAYAPPGQNYGPAQPAATHPATPPTGPPPEPHRGVTR